MMISGHTKPFAVLGHPIGHTLSPVMHNAAFRALEWDAIYLAFDVKPEALMNVLKGMAEMGFQGVNLTIPLKEAAFRDLAKLDESARLLGAVNTVQFDHAGLIGHNTDGEGFLRALREAFGKTAEGDRVFVLGAGGAGRAVSLVACGAGAREVLLADIDEQRCTALASEIRRLYPDTSVRVVTDDGGRTDAAASSDLIIQATPIGMKRDDPVLLGDEAFHEGQRVFDLIYMYPETGILCAAKAKGAMVSNGLGMLLHQGARAFSIWTGAEPPVDVMRQALEEVVYKE